MSETNETPPWADTPTCPECKRAGMLAHVPAEDDGPALDEDGDLLGMDHSEALAALNDCDVPEWLWCPCCEDVIDAGAAAYRKAARADEWAARPDREEAWAEVLRQRRIDAVAVEHAARQGSLFGGEG